VDDPRVTHVGTIMAEQGVWLQRAGDRRLLEARGWEHGL